MAIQRAIRATLRCRGGGAVAARMLSGHPATASRSSYVINLVKKHDYESYLCLLLLPKQWRYPCFVFHSYNVELSLILESAREPRAALGRFAFWSDALDGMFADKRPYEHPVTVEMTTMLRSLGSASTKKRLTDMLTARQQLSRTSLVSSVRQLEEFGERTRSSLLYLCLASAGRSDVNADHAASHLGRCLALVTALRSTPYLAARNELLLPQELLSKHGVSQQDVLRRRPAVAEPVFDLASAAHDHLLVAGDLLAKVDREARPLFLPLAICEHRLELLRRCDFNVFDERFQRRNSLLPWHLWRKKRQLGKL